MSWKLLEVKVTSYYEESKQARIMVEGIKREHARGSQKGTVCVLVFVIMV